MNNYHICTCEPKVDHSDHNKEMSGDWDEDWDKDWDEDYDYYEDESNFDFEGDWFGDLLNPPCQEELTYYDDCDFGEICLLSYYTDSCTNETTCVQSLTWDWEEWEEYDCTDGVVFAEQYCEIECFYEECGPEHSTDDVCWVEICEDGCGFYNCSLWYQIENEWFGEYCEEEPEPLISFPDFRMGDVIRTVRETGSSYEDTIRQTFDTLCDAEDKECNQGADTIIGVL